MNDQQKKMLAGGAFGVLAVGVIWFELSGSGGTPASPPPPVITTVGTPTGSSTGSTSRMAGTTAKRSVTTVAELDPTLRMGPMLVTESLVYTGSGRNIFSGSSVPISVPKPIAPARPKPTVQQVRFTAPVGPPPPPPIDLKFFGTATTASGSRQAFLLKGDDVFLASPGDVVQRRYKVLSIAANSMVVEDMANSNRQTLPLLVN